ncbi:MAG: hypothetical protein ACFB9M_18695 [Myxococcota bacterium]
MKSDSRLWTRLLTWSACAVLSAPGSAVAEDEASQSEPEKPAPSMQPDTQVQRLRPRRVDTQKLRERLKEAPGSPRAPGKGARRPPPIPPVVVKEQRASVAEEARKHLGGRPVSSAYRREAYRHAERLARIERVREVAFSLDDNESAARATRLLKAEEARHRAWLDRLVPTDTVDGGAP